jgi:hypothetical protein
MENLNLHSHTEEWGIKNADHEHQHQHEYGSRGIVDTQSNLCFDCHLLQP